MIEVKNIFTNRINQNKELELTIEQVSNNKFMLLIAVPYTNHRETLCASTFSISGLIHTFVENKGEFTYKYIPIEDLKYHRFMKKFVPILTSHHWIFKSTFLINNIYKKERKDIPLGDPNIFYCEINENNYISQNERIYIISNSEKVLKRFIELEFSNSENEYNEIDEIYIHMTEPPLVFRLVESFDSSLITTYNFDKISFEAIKGDSVNKYNLDCVRYQDYVVKTINENGFELFKNDVAFVGFNVFNEPCIITNFRRIITELSLKSRKEKINYLTSESEICLISKQIQIYDPISIYAFDEVAFNKFKKLCKKEGVKVKKI